MAKKKKILFVGLSDSIHASKWINLVDDRKWKKYFFSVNNAIPNPDFKNIRIIDGIIGRRPKNHDKSISSFGLWPFRLGSKELGNFYELVERYTQNYCLREFLLYLSIIFIKPDIVHSMEFQHSCYRVLEVKKKMGDKFPVWLVTNWGSDIHLFRHFKDDEEKIKEILKYADYYSCECIRDAEYAKKYGFEGVILPVIPNSGGLDLSLVNPDFKDNKPSMRKKIIMKGYQGWAGRAMFGLKALEKCSDLLSGYEIIIYSADRDMKIAAERSSHECGLKITILDNVNSSELLKEFGSSRIYIGLSISDGISTSLLEAIACGAFPIQSDTSCADEWIQPGKTGFIVDPEDIEEISLKIRSALADDVLVDSAAGLNYVVAEERIDSLKLKEIVNEDYLLMSKGK